VTPRSQRLLTLAIRALVVTVVALAAITAALGFLDARVEYWADGSSHTYPTDRSGVPLLIAMIAFALPGVLAWKWPEPRTLFSWVVIGWITALGYHVIGPGDTHFDRSSAGTEWLWPCRAVEILSALTTVVIIVATPLAAFATVAVRATYDGESPKLATRLRRIAHLVVAIGLVVMAVGFLPGERVYSDSNNCFGRAVVGFEHPSSECTSRYDQLDETRLAGGVPLVLYIVSALAPAILIQAEPRRRRGWHWLLWSLLTGVGGLAVLFLLTFHLDLFAHTVQLWPQTIVIAGTLAIMALLLLALPLVLLLTRDGPAEPPEARVHRDRATS
jgi:hypothetical protein